MVLTSKLAARHLVGRTIVGVDVVRRDGDEMSGGQAAHEIERILLDDGSALRFVVAESHRGAFYVVEGVRVKPSNTSTKRT